MVQVSIEYDKEQYAPGDTVSVRILVDILDSPKKIRVIEISVIGGAFVKWEESKSNSRRDFYRSTHTYIALSDVLLGSAGEKIVLSVGQHIYHYKFTLPLACDSSYKKSWGKIKYECLVEVERAFPRCNIREKKKFLVYHPVDLQALSRISSPVSRTLETRFLPFKKGSITMEGMIHDACYLPGQTIYLDVSIFNRAPRTIKMMQIRLVESTTYIAFYGSRAHERVNKERLVNLSENVQIVPNSDHFYACEIEIPHFTPIHNYCTNIKVQYYLKVLVSTSSFFTSSLFACSHSLKIPLVIGTIPTTHINPLRTSSTHQHQMHVHSDTERSRIDSEQSSDASYYSLNHSSSRRQSEESSNTLFNSSSHLSLDAPDYSKYNDRSALLQVD